MFKKRREMEIAETAGIYNQKLKELLNIDLKLMIYFNNKYEALTDSNIQYAKDTQVYITFYVVDEKDEYISQFKLVQMPGCCGICISTEVSVNTKYRGKGVNTILNNFRIELARYLGYGLLLCTDIADNIPEVKTLDKNGWKHVYNFNNPRTGNDLNISVKPLLSKRV